MHTPPYAFAVPLLLCGVMSVEAAEQTEKYLEAVTSAATHTMNAPAAGEVAGEIFGQPVSVSNYHFAKRVAFMFSRPWGAADLPEADREAFIWEQLILHYESFQRGITVSDDELERTVNQFLKDQQLTLTRGRDPEAYRQWLSTHLNEPVELFENQLRYLIQIRLLRDRARDDQRVSVTEEEMEQEFLNEHHHVGGEMIVFDTKEKAQEAYARFKEPPAWEAMKAAGEFKVRSVSLMTLEAYMDLWGIPKEPMYAFHALAIGAVGPPMPFGKQWCVYRLLEKRTGELNEFPAVRASYAKQVEQKKKYAALAQWIEQLKSSARLKVLPGY